MRGCLREVCKARRHVHHRSPETSSPIACTTVGAVKQVVSTVPKAEVQCYPLSLTTYLVRRYDRRQSNSDGTLDRQCLGVNQPLDRQGLITFLRVPEVSLELLHCHAVLSGCSVFWQVDLSLP